MCENEYFRTINDENKENVTIVWYDPNIGFREDTIKTQEELRQINDYVIFHRDVEECISFIESSSNETIFLITSGREASKIIPRILSFPQIDSIFIFCMKKSRYEYLLEDYSKIIGIYIELNDLCESIREQLDLIDKQLQTFCCFDQHQKATRDLSKESACFLWFHLFNHVICRLPKDEQSKQQMIEMCQNYYRGNRKILEIIHQFEREYRSEDSIRWYSKQTFIYQLVNKALRTEDMDLLYKFRFFITDLSISLENQQRNILSSEETILTVYRGSKINEDEFNKLKENQGKLISTNGYLSTSRLRSKALLFAMKSTKRTDVISVLFQIKCYIQQINTSVTYADICHLSEYPTEQEILFGLNACFRLESIEQKESFYIIYMNVSNEGQQITKDYIDITQKETEKKSVSIIFGKLMCDLGQYDKSLRYFLQLLNNPINEDMAWITLSIGRVLHLKGEWDEARIYYNYAYDLMMNEEPPRLKDSALVFNNIGILLENQGQYNEALDYYKRALMMKQKYYPSGCVDIASSLNNVGSILYIQENYDEALQYYVEALEIKQNFYQCDHPSIAVTLNNIGNIFEHQRKYDEALNYYQQSLNMRQKYYPCDDHIDIAQSFNNTGLILFEQGLFEKALDYYQRALKIQEKHYPSGHIDLAKSLNNIGIYYEKQKETKMALEY